MAHTSDQTPKSLLNAYDIRALEKYPDTAGFAYVDLSVQKAHQAALDRWPLLRAIDAPTMTHTQTKATASIVGSSQ